MTSPAEPATEMHEGEEPAAVEREARATQAAALDAASRVTVPDIEERPTLRPPPREDSWAAVAFSFVRRLSPVPKASPDHRVLAKGPRGTALLGVPALDATWKAKGPRGTALLGLARPALPARAQEPAQEQGITASQSFSHLASLDRHRMLQTVIATSVGVLVAFAIGGYVLLKFIPEPPAADAATTPHEPAPAVTVNRAPVAPAAAPAAAASSSKPALPSADAAAIAALEALRASVERCRNEIRALPGTSPAVPSSLAALKAGPYQPMSNDWRSPFFRCTDFRIEGPMPFVLQWQFHRATSEGQGIAWIDEGGDGVADRAYAFTVRAIDSAIDYGPVAPVSAATVIKQARR